MNKSAPVDPNNYKLIDTFNSAGTADDHTMTYPATTGWVTCDGNGAALYPLAAAGFLTANAAVGLTDWLALSGVAETVSVTDEGFGLPGNNYRLSINLTANNVSVAVFIRCAILEAASRPLTTEFTAGYKLKLKEDAGNDLIKLKMTDAEGGGEIADTTGALEAVLSTLSPASNLIVHMEHTKTQLICSIGGATRAWNLPLYNDGEGVFGFNVSAATTAKINSVRIW